MEYNGLIDRVNQVIGSYQMQLTLRQIYYRLVASGDIKNTRSNYTQLSSQLVKARENGDIDGNRIVDRSRRINDISFDSPEHFIDTCLDTLENNYIRRFWNSQPVYCELWVEKDALSQVFADALYQFNTVVAPSRGYSSYTYLQSAANRINRYCEDSKSATILYFGDHDPSGLDMTRDLSERLNKYGCRVDVMRIALNYRQVNEYKLIPNPVKIADKRSQAYIDKYGNQCWELDAVEPSELVKLCQQAVEDSILDKPAWLKAVESEKRERELLINRIKGANND